MQDMPAFPLQHTIADANDPSFKTGQSGLTMRDYFAIHCRRDFDVQFAALFNSNWAAWMCYRRASAMIKAREGKDAINNAGLTK